MANNPLAPFGCPLLRLRPHESGTGLACSQATTAGAPLLAVPLAACWSLQAALRECPPLADAIRASLGRGSDFTDELCIALHLVYESKRGGKGLRKSHLDLLPHSPESLLAWDDLDVEALKGSWWYEEALRRKRQASLDFQALKMELGEACAAALGLDETAFLWALQIVEQFGVRLMESDGTVRTLLVPGTELFSAAGAAPESAAGARLDRGDLAKSSVFIFVAEKDCCPGDRVGLSHGGLACGNGCRMSTCGSLLAENAWDDVMLAVPLRIDGENESLLQNMAQACSAGLLEGNPAAEPGECVATQPLLGTSSSPVEVVAENDDHLLCRVLLRFTKAKLLPPREVLTQLGVALLADSSKQDVFMAMEKDMAGVFNEDCCEMRALAHLQQELQALLEKYPSLSKESLAHLARAQADSSSRLLPRSARAVQLLQGERALLREVFVALQQRLGLLLAAVASESPLENSTPAPRGGDAVRLQASGLLVPLNGEVAPNSPLAKALSSLRGATSALKQLALRILLAEADEGFRAEFEVLQGILKACPLGDPSSYAVLPRISSKAELVQVQGAAATAALSTEAALLEWEVGKLQKGAAPQELARKLLELARLRRRLLDFQGASADLSAALELKKKDAAIDVPQEDLEACALGLAAGKDAVLLTAKWSDAAGQRALKSLREKLKDIGYLSSWGGAWPSRVPPVSSVALEFESAGSAGGDGNNRIKPGTYITKKSSEGPSGPCPSGRLDPSIMPFVLPQGAHSQKLVCAIRLFLLHKVLPQKSVRELLGDEPWSLLLSSGALSLLRLGQVLSPEEAAKVPASETAISAFANVLLWPVPSDDLLLALDFEQNGPFKPVPYLGQDSRALFAGSPGTAASVLDAMCGSGAQGLMALQRGAKKATFLDPNPRAIRFARFNACLNGKADQCSFIQGDFSSKDLGRYDAILCAAAQLPNPQQTVTNGGAAFSAADDDGEGTLSALVAKSSSLLAPGGHLLAAAMLPNPGALGWRLLKWADAAGPADVRGVVLRGKPTADEDFVHLATQACPATTAAAYLAALRQSSLRSVSETLVLLQAAAGVPKHAARVEMMPEHAALWSDEAFLKAEVLSAMERLSAAAALDASSTALYSLDWSKGSRAKAGGGVPIVRPGLQQPRKAGEYSIVLDKTQGTNLGAQVKPGEDEALLRIEAVLGGLFQEWNLANPRMQVSKGDCILEINGIRGSSVQMLEECKQKKVLELTLQRKSPEQREGRPTPSQKGEFLGDACRWKDIAMHRLFGWSPPALCDWRWYKSAPPLSVKQRGMSPTGFTMAIVELQNCRCPSEVKEALRAINCTHRYTFEGDHPRSTLKPMDKSWSAKDVTAILDRYDVLILPLETGGGRGVQPLHHLPIEMLYFLEAITRYVYSTRRAIRLVMLTCGCSGPSYAGMTDDGWGLPAAVPLRGIFRCSRIENLQVPILHIDSDALLEPGRGKELAAQVDVEVELSTPDIGFYKADVNEQNRALMQTHREVCYRGGVRFLPKLDLSARNPIFPGAKIPMLLSAAEGVAIITGGTGGLGILTAEALVESGVKVVVLSSRSGKISRGYQGLEARLDKLRISGARIELEACDAKDEGQVQRFLQKVRTDYGPIKWIMNAAGIVLPQDPNLLEPVFEPKCIGAWNMHKHSLGDDIQTFMMYSSMSAGAGANDLANYAAANTYIDELARLRQSQGLSAVSVMFPEVEEAGMAADTIFVKGNAANIPPGNVKQTVKQILCGKGPMAPCIVIMAQGYLIPRSPTMDSMLEPLKARVDKDLWDKLIRMETTAGK